MPTYHRFSLLLLAVPVLARALPQRVQVSSEPDSQPAADNGRGPDTSTPDEDFLAGFFQSPALLGITVALAVSLLVASLVTIMRLMRARRRTGVRGRESIEGAGGVRGGGRGLAEWMRERGGSLGRTVGGVRRNVEKAGEGGGWWRFWRWGRGVRKGGEAGKKARREERGEKGRGWEDNQFW
ncbi:hypothetical protein MMC17_004256 [Xylographa soralifera]|nr:hypothetical protein [Xylographa soralifera]